MAAVANQQSYLTAQEAASKLQIQNREQRRLVKKLGSADTQDSAHQEEVAYLNGLKQSLENDQGLANAALAKIEASKRISPKGMDSSLLEPRRPLYRLYRSTIARGRKLYVSLVNTLLHSLLRTREKFIKSHYDEDSI
jgi:hypothetical protein